MLEKLKQIIAVTDNRVLGQVVKSNSNYPLYDWLVNETKNLSPSATVKERINAVLTGETPECKYGNVRIFYAYDNGYKFCNTVDKCQCHKEHYEANHIPLDAETIKTILEKRKETWKEKYGVDNPSKNCNIKNKRKLTMQDRSYDMMRSKLNEKLQDIGYQAVIDRVKDYVTPAFTRDEYTGCFRKNFYKWKCNFCGQEVLDHVDYGRIPRCLNCNPKSVSKNEIELREWIGSLGLSVEGNTKEILGDKEFDIWLPEKNIAVEFNGIYWHSSKWKDPNYHVDKFIRSRDKGIRLIQIFEDEWINKQDIIKSRLKSVLGISDRIYARNCSIKTINKSEYKSFCIKYHLQGYASASIVYGLYHNDILIAVMSFGKSRYTKDGFELIRYCSISTVIGGASKLFKRFIKDHNPTRVISYANRCWSNGKLYEALGFTNVTKNDRNTGYWYFKNHTRYHRTSFVKSRLIKLGFDQSKTEEQIMSDAGYLKIYDCGNYKFNWSPK